MATVVIYADTASNTIQSQDTVYATARSGGTLTSGTHGIGQFFGTPTYTAWEPLLSFDTSTVGTPYGATLSLAAGVNPTYNVNFTMEASTYDWGATFETADWVPGASLSATPVATLALTGQTFTQDVYFDLVSQSGFPAAVNVGGFTRLVIGSAELRTGSAPGGSGDQSISFRNADSAGTTVDPKLTIVEKPATSADLILVPGLDVAINSWTTDTGGTTSLFAAIDETTASDTDYIQSPAGPTTAQYYEAALETHVDPSSSTGHIVHYRYQKNVAGGNVDLTVELYEGATLRKSYAHTGISNSWTQQDQTLSGAEADSITDYSDLRLRFTPDMVTTDQTVPVPTKVADRATANSNSAVTTVDLVLTSLTVGNYLIIRSAADNTGGGGAARSMTVSNQSGTAMGTHTEYQYNVDPGAASAGSTCNISIIKIAATSGTIRLTYAGSVVQSCVAEEWSGIDPTTPVVQNSGAGGINTSTLGLATLLGVVGGNLVYYASAVEGPSSDTYTVDTDTVNGSWAGLTKVGTTNATADTNQTTWGMYKVVTATGSQTPNASVSPARDSGSVWLELAAAPTPAPTIKAQVSWANFELPVSGGGPAPTRSVSANVGSAAFPTAGPVSFGAGDL